jgi:hypothetical protein
MRVKFGIIFIIFLPLFVSAAKVYTVTDSAIDKDELRKTLIKLDNVIKESEIYNAEKQSKIERIKKEIKNIEQFSLAHYNLNSKLIKLNYAYLCDTTLYYLNQNIEIARALNDKKLLNESIIKAASFMAYSAGMYRHASDILKEIDGKIFTKEDSINYYQAELHIYDQLAQNTQDFESVDKYGKIAELYKDSLMRILPAESEQRLLLTEERMRNQDKFSEALKINDIRLSMDSFGSSEYALAAFHRAYTYRMMGDKERYKYYLAMSALSDIKTATRDHASLWMLAETLIAGRDIDRAYNYVRFSWNEISLFNAQVRKWQSANILYAIDGLYDKMLKKQNFYLHCFIVVISLLVILLSILLFYNYSHRKKLYIMGSNLQNTNDALLESNRIKEEYIGQFIRMCSVYIDKLDDYRRFVIKKIKNEQTEDLLLISEKERELRKETDDLLRDFDTAFLNIFPNFIEKFNELLLPDQQIILKKGEILNTELRVYALIRLGINDSAKIAEFLRLSVNTVYNSRAKVKSKTIIARDEFEDKVRLL